MKLKTSFFNPTVLRKDVTRFAPAWVLYTLFLVIVQVMTMSYRSPGGRAQLVSSMLAPTAVVSFFYAPLAAQLLFGDLYRSRLCNALHAMPLRREAWFATHVIAGLLFSLVPNLVLTLFTAPMLGSYWTVAFWWLLASQLQFLFFFGLSVFCVFCVGNGFAMALVYGILNFLSLLIYWFLTTLYEPLLPGVSVPFEPFRPFCPVVELTMHPLLTARPIPDSLSADPELVIRIANGWGYLGVCTLLGVVLLGVSLLLYRRRHLECAGDFMAVTPMEPVFLVLYTLSAGAFLHAFSSLFLGYENYVALVIGITAGFFTGLMLLRRTTRVFRKPAWIGFALLTGLLALSLMLTKFDVLGLVTKMPELSQIQSAQVQEGHPDNMVSGLTLEDPRDLEQLQKLHTLALEQARRGNSRQPYDGPRTTVTIRYHLKNGSSLTRYYPVDVPTDASELMKEFLSRMEAVLGFAPEEIPQNASKLVGLYVEGEYHALTPDQAESLLLALAQDCEDRTTAQSWALRHDADNDIVLWMDLSFTDPNLETSLQLPSSCVHTFSWLEQNGVYTLLPQTQSAS